MTAEGRRPGRPRLDYPSLRQSAAVRASAMLRQDHTYLVRRRHVLSLHGHEPCVHFGLTAREVEVATLIARGLSDQAMATRLGISLRTAEHHTEHVLRKLSVDRRSAVAALLASSSTNLAERAGRFDGTKAHLQLA